MQNQKTQAQLLEEQYAILNAIYKCMPVGIEVFDKDGFLVTINDKGLELYGLHCKADADKFNLFKDPNLSKKSAQALQNGVFLKSIVNYDFNKWIEMGCHSYHTTPCIFEVKMTTLKDANNEKIGYLLVTEDITEKELQKKELNDSRNELKKLNIFLKTIIQNIPAGLFITDISTGKYIIVNKQLANIYKKNISDFIDNTMYEFLDKSITDEFEKNNTECIKLDGKVYSNTRNLLIDGKTVSLSLKEKLVHTIDGNSYLIGIEEDTTKKVLFMKELEQAKKEAETSNKLKSVFLTNMSHEIRTPLNAIVGFSNLITTAETQEEQKEYSNIININSDVLLCLINDILDFSKIESGSLKLRPEIFDFSIFFNEIAESFKQRINIKEINYIIENPCNSYLIKKDRNRLAQSITNYVTNAIKYTPHGYIKIGYSLKNNGIEVYVSDSGIGIADNMKEKVFNRFEKLDQFAQGNGLGLSITKGLIESMGGKVSFNSQIGKGSTFIFWIPCDETN